MFPNLGLGEKLRLFIKVVEALTGIEIVFPEHAGMPATDVARRHVLKTAERRASLGEVEYVSRAAHVDAHAELARNGEVVNRREMKDLVDRLQIDPRGDVALHDLHAIAELGCALLRERREFRLHEADCRRLGRARQNARQKRGAEESGVAGEEDAQPAKRTRVRSATTI